MNDERQLDQVIYLILSGYKNRKRIIQKQNHRICASCPSNTASNDQDLLLNVDFIYFYQSLRPLGPASSHFEARIDLGQSSTHVNTYQ